MNFWAVLSSRGCREKNLSTALSKQLFGGGFSNFLWAKKNLNLKNKHFSTRTKKLHNIKLSNI
jgi:hypothetical protein